MAQIKYLTIPQQGVFTKDSKVMIGSRASDSILMKIDSVLSDYHFAANEILSPAELKLQKTLNLGRLYFATDLWLKEVSRGHGNTGRKPAIQALFERVCWDLANRTGYTINVLPDWIEATFGRGKNLHTVELDIKTRCAKYLTNLEKEKYRIKFSNMRAQQQAWWNASTTLTNANSSLMLPSGKAFPWQGHSGYVLSMGGDFFAGPHFTKGGLGHKSSFFHSSYLSGGSVKCAGSWKVTDGVVQEISDASGHYAPAPVDGGPTSLERSEDAMISAVETLQSYGVNIATLKVFFYANTPAGGNVHRNLANGETGVQFLKRAERLSVKASRLAFLHQKNLTKLEMEKLRKIAIENARVAGLRVKKELGEMAVHFATKKHIVLKHKPNNKINCTLCGEKRQLWSQAEQLAKAKNMKV